MFKGGTQPKKNDVVHTPNWLIDKIYRQVNRRGYKTILDVGCYNGALSKPWQRIKGTHIIGVDVIDEYKNNFIEFVHAPYLDTNIKDYSIIKPDVVIMNPPFSELQGYTFIEHTIKLFGNIPIIAIVPTYILDNSKKRSDKLNKLNITRTIILDTFTFGNQARIHTQLIFINIPFKKTKQYEYWYKPADKIKGRYRSIYTNKNEEEKLQLLLKNYGGNFNKMVKSLIKKEMEQVKFIDRVF